MIKSVILDISWGMIGECWALNEKLNVTSDDFYC